MMKLKGGIQMFKFKDFDNLTDGVIDLRLKIKHHLMRKKAMYLHINIGLLYIIQMIV